MKLILGDCLEVLSRATENSVDAVVTDPPYGLVSIQKRFGKEGSAPAQYGKDGSFARLSGGFMGKQWDGSGIEYSIEFWGHVLRVLKPGGHLLSFGGSRTYHRMACAIEDAGFEIRDQIMWIYGSGFPKSLNIGKAVDKLQGNEREDLGYNDNSRTNKPDVDVYEAGIRGKESRLTKGTSEWEGYGTALKPAHEPIVLARKPLSEKTIAENCLKWGVGGLNIDGCRVGTKAKSFIDNRTDKVQQNCYGKYKEGTDYDGSQGRFPANLIHDGSDEVVDLFPESKSGARKKGFSNKQKGYNATSYEMRVEWNKDAPADSGSAARFFYCAKASKAERNRGCEGLEKGCIHPTVKPIALMKYLIKLITREGQTVLDPFMGSGTTGIACKELGREFIGIEKEPEYLEIAKRRIYYERE